jgi:hypothetical protein
MLQTEHDPEKCVAVFRRIMPQTKSQGAVAIQPNLTALRTGCSPSVSGAYMPRAKPGVTVSAIEQAPFVYFDGVSCFGQHGGTIQIELAAHVLTPEGGGVKIQVAQTAHVRCSPAAARALRDVLDKALAMVQKGQSGAQPIPTLKN